MLPAGGCGIGDGVGILAAGCGCTIGCGVATGGGVGILAAGCGDGDTASLLSGWVTSESGMVGATSLERSSVNAIVIPSSPPAPLLQCGHVAYFSLS